MIIAPILAVISWFAVDYYVKETPHKLKAGGNYKLQVKPGCRWGSGVCELTNNEVKFRLTATQNNYNTTILLHSSIELTGVQVALTSSATDITTRPSAMFSSDNVNYAINVDSIGDNQFLQLIMAHGDTLFYATVPTIWIYKEELIYDKQ
jgi:hypothetical protein